MLFLPTWCADRMRARESCRTPPTPGGRCVPPAFLSPSQRGNRLDPAAEWPRVRLAPTRWPPDHISGLLNMLFGPRGAGIARFGYASSNSIYGGPLSLSDVKSRLLTPYCQPHDIDRVLRPILSKTAAATRWSACNTPRPSAPKQDSSGLCAGI